MYEKLRAEPWIDPWLDEEELFPGMDWNLEIEKAIEATDVILVCLSNNSITKEGYVQREIRIALDYADYKPEGALFIIPVRLEECNPPRRLSKWQYEDFFGEKHERAFDRLLVSLRTRAYSLGLRVVDSKSTKGEIIDLEFINDPIVLSNEMEFHLVRAGIFTMGENSDEHKVDIPYDYWMAHFLVTNVQYSDYAKTKKNIPIDNKENKKDHPVVGVNWNDVLIYCRWLSELHKNELPIGTIIRLPTEAEWEKSAGGFGRYYTYPWGPKYDEKRFNGRESGNKDTTPVGLYSPKGDSRYGCADMVGNVWEWTHSLKKEYPYIVNDGREDERVPGSRVLRGGSFMRGNSYKVTYRVGYYNDDLIDIGFRVCIAPPLSSIK